MESVSLVIPTVVLKVLYSHIRVEMSQRFVKVIHLRQNADDDCDREDVG